MSEAIKCENIIEVKQIQKILSIRPDLLKIFNNILKVADGRMNAEKPCYSMPIEQNKEPELSDHSSDSDLEDL